MSPEHVYNSLRAEATQGFTAVRQLAVGESAAIAIVLVELLRSKSLYAIVACEVVIVGLVYFAARSGRDWYIQATRQLSYVLVAHELPERQNAKTQGPTSFPHWILADRSESFYHTHIRDDGQLGRQQQPAFRTHLPGRELHTFLVHQFWLVLITVVAAGIIFERTFPVRMLLGLAPAVTVPEQRLVAAFWADVPLMVVAGIFYVARRHLLTA
jgi:exosortase/archaeosortase